MAISSKSALRLRLYPQSLYTTMLTLISLTIVLVITMLSSYHAYYQSALTIARKTEEIKALAQSLAISSAIDLKQNHVDEVYELAKMAITYPGVVSISYYDDTGTLFYEVADKQIKNPATVRPAFLADDNSHQIPAPTPIQLILNQRRYIDEWSPLIASNQHGWIKVTYDMAELREQTQQIWSDSLIFALLAILCVMIVTRRILAPCFSALKQATEFAAKLDTNHGNVLTLDNNHIELRTLNQTLNHLSQRLHLQQQELNESIEQLSAILDNVSEGIISIDSSGTIQTFNKAASTIFGYTVDDVVGKNVNILMPEPYHSAHDGFIQHYLNTGQAKIIGSVREVEGKRKNEIIFPLELSISRCTHLGQPFFIGLIRDLTERKRSQQLKREFVSTVSHELRTPITAISGALALVKSGVLGKLPEQAQPLIETAVTNSHHLTQLIDDLLDIDKLLSGKMQFNFVVQPVMPIIESALNSLQTYGQKFDVNFNICHAEHDAWINVDERRLQQVLRNLLSNAAKFSEQSKDVGIAVTLENDQVKISVKDYGTGIPEEFQSRVFHKFSQADASDTRGKGGTGLGLAISKNIMLRMHGDLLFESASTGTTFYILLPKATPALQSV